MYFNALRAEHFWCKVKFNLHVSKIWKKFFNEIILYDAYLHKISKKRSETFSLGKFMINSQRHTLLMWHVFYQWYFKNYTISWFFADLQSFSVNFKFSQIKAFFEKNSNTFNIVMIDNNFQCCTSFPILYESYYANLLQKF